MNTADLKNIKANELRLKLDALNVQEHFKDVLEHARFFASENKIEHSNICCSWLINHRKDFAPAYIQLCSNYLRTKDFRSIDELLSPSFDVINAHSDQATLLHYMHGKALLELGYIDRALAYTSDIKEWESKPLWYNLLETDILFKSGRIDKLLALLDDKISFYADNSVFVKKKVEVLNKTGQSNEAYRQILRALDNDENNLELLFQKAMINYDKQEFLEAKLSYSKIIKLSNDYKAHLWIGRIHRVEGDDELADYHLGQSVKLAKSDSDRLHCLNILAELSEDERIDQLVSQWFVNEHRSPENLLELARVRSKQLKFKLSRDLLLEAIKLSEDPKLYFELAKVYSSLKDYDQAESILVLKKLMYSPPIDFFARNEYCLIAKRRGRWVEALQRFKDFSSLYPENFDIKSEIVNILIKLSEYAEAYDFLKSEIKHNPQNQKAWKSIIDCFYLNQNYFEALEFIEKYNSRFGEDEKLFYYKSACLREVGRYDASKEVLERGLNLFPESFDLKMSYAHLYRRLSSEFFFEKDDYNRKAHEIHKSAKPLYAYQQRVLNTEIINDLVHLNQYSEALRMIENLLEEKPDHIELYHQKVRVLSKMGNHSESYALIKQLPEELREDIQLKILEANELLALDMWEECNKLLEKILDEENMPDALITQVKLYLRQGAHGKAKNSFRTLFELSPHHAFIYNDLIDFALTNQDLYPDFYEKLGIKHTICSNDLLQLHANELVETDGMLVMSFEKNVTVSHIVLKNGQSFIEQINISKNGTDFKELQTIPHKSSLSGQDIIIEGVFDVKSIKLPLDKRSELTLYTIYPVHTDGSIRNEIKQGDAVRMFTMNIVETGLGDQLHYIRTSALIAESLGMQFEGFLRSQLEIIRDRVTEDPRLYNDLGFTQFLIEDDDYHIVPVHLNLKTRFIPALYQWNSYNQFLEYIKALIEEAVRDADIANDKTPLIYLSIDDHNFTRLVAKLFYPFHEPESQFIHTLRKVFAQQRSQRMVKGNSSKMQVLLQCRLGDVANIPVRYKDENVWVIPFSGEVMKDNIANKYHMRYSNLEKIREIGQRLKAEFGDSIDLKLITDGYDYGIEYLKEFQQNLVSELGLDYKELDQLKTKLHDDFNKQFEFVDEIVYGEEYDKLIRSIDLVTSSSVLISTNGQFTNEFKMSFASYDEEYLIVKKLYSNLRVSRSPSSKELFWEIQGSDNEDLLKQLIEFIKANIKIEPAH